MHTFYRRRLYQQSNDENSIPVETMCNYNHATPGYAPPLSNGVYPEAYGGGNLLPPQHTIRIYCRANDGYCITVRDGAVVLAPKNPKDDYQVIFS
jgi:hypothetical protein